MEKKVHIREFASFPQRKIKFGSRAKLVKSFGDWLRCLRRPPRPLSTSPCDVTRIPNIVCQSPSCIQQKTWCSNGKSLNLFLMAMTTLFASTPIVRFLIAQISWRARANHLRLCLLPDLVSTRLIMFYFHIKKTQVYSHFYFQPELCPC